MGHFQAQSRPNADIWWDSPKKSKQQWLREERDKEFKIIEDAKNILAEAIGIEVDSTQPILHQLVEEVQNFNEDTYWYKKLVKKAEKKFENKVLEHITQ